jgi:hypothetical protein
MGSNVIFCFGWLEIEPVPGWTLSFDMCFWDYQDARAYLGQFPTPGRMIRRWLIKEQRFG